MARPWEQQPNETGETYRAFLVYRGLGKSRTVERAHEELLAEAEEAGESSGNGRGGNRVPTLKTMRATATRNEWVSRARAWDNHLRRKLDCQAAADAAKWEREKRRATAEALDDADRLLEKARLMLRWPLKRREAERREADGKTVVTIHVLPARWSMKDAASLISLAAELKAATLGAASMDLGDMSDAELDATINAGLEDASDGLEAV